MATLIALLAADDANSGGTGALFIVGVLVLIVLAVGAVWTFAARRASRMPDRSEHPHDPGVRGG